MSSCMSTYDVTHQKSIYEAQMSSSRSGKALMEKIPVFYSEKDVPYDFSVVSYGVYKPLTIPIFRSEKKVLTKKFYTKAVKSAEHQNGNAVIIDSFNTFRVIKKK